MRRTLAVLLISFLSACADSHQLLRTNHEVQKLDRNKVVYVSVPKDGRYGQINYAGSGQNTTQIISMAFSQYSRRVETGHEYQAFEQALDSARKQRAGYFVWLTILEWEDRATEWSGISDKASIKISVIDTAPGTPIDSVIIKGKSGLATFGGDHPQDLLQKPVNEYVKSMFQ